MKQGLNEKWQGGDIHTSVYGKAKWPWSICCHYFCKVVLQKIFPEIILKVTNGTASWLYRTWLEWLMSQAFWYNWKFWLVGPIFRLGRLYGNGLDNLYQCSSLPWILIKFEEIGPSITRKLKPKLIICWFFFKGTWNIS